MTVLVAMLSVYAVLAGGVIALAFLAFEFPDQEPESVAAVTDRVFELCFPAEFFLFFFVLTLPRAWIRSWLCWLNIALGCALSIAFLVAAADSGQLDDPAWLVVDAVRVLGFTVGAASPAALEL